MRKEIKRCVGDIVTLHGKQFVCEKALPGPDENSFLGVGLCTGCYFYDASDLTCEGMKCTPGYTNSETGIIFKLLEYPIKNQN